MGYRVSGMDDLYTPHKSFISQTRSYVSPAKARAYTPINRGDVLFPTSGETIEDDWQVGRQFDAEHSRPFLWLDHLIIFRANSSNGAEVCGLLTGLVIRLKPRKSLMGRGITIM